MPNVQTEQFLSIPDNSHLNSSVNTDPLAPQPPPMPVPGQDSLRPPAWPIPARDPVWTGWDVLQIAALALLAILGMQAAVLFVTKEFIYPRIPLRDLVQKPILAIVAQLIAYLLVAQFMVMLVEGKYHVRFGQAIRWNWPASRAWLFLAIGVATVVLDFLSRFLPMPKSTPFEEFFERPLDAYLISIFAITLGPLMEELFFRGFLYPLIARRLGAVWGVLLTALPFALMHSVQYGNAWSAVLVIFLVGVVLTTVRAVTNSVASGLLVHVSYNATLMLLAALATDGFRHMEKALFVGR